MVNKKILPLSKPLCRTYPHTAHALAILQNDPKVLPWLLNSFIQIEGWDTENMDFEDFWILECPLLQYQRIEKDFILNKWYSFDNFIQNSIHNGYYVYIVVDTKKIQAYGGTDIPHDVLVYGYDNDNITYHIADFFQGKRYGTDTATYDEMSNALNYSDNSFERHWIFDNDVILLKPRKSVVGKFSPERVKLSLEDYLNCKGTQYWYHRSQKCYVKYRYELIYGMKNYYIIYKHIDQILVSGNVLEHWRQVFHFFYEHKKTMRVRLEYMNDHNYIKRGDKYIIRYKEMEEKALFIRNQIIDFVRTGMGLVSECKDKVREIEEVECDILPSIIKDIVIDYNDESCGLIFNTCSVTE